jgi:hypothetical protein
MQIKTTLRFHLTPVRIAIIKLLSRSPTTTTADEDAGEKGTFIHC